MDQRKKPNILILLTDDQALFRAGLRVVLDAQDDMRVVGEASDGAEALALKDRGGHSNIDTTRRYYVRPKGNRDAEIARAMDELLSPKPQNEGYLYAIYGDTVADF